MNWTRGLFRLWLVASLLWAVAVGWLTWPDDAPQQYVRYWYYRVAHPEVLDERLANAAAAEAKRDKAVAEIRARYDRTRATHVSSEGAAGTGQKMITDHDLAVRVLKILGIDYGQQDPSDQELDEVGRALKTDFAQPGSPQLQEFTRLEATRDWHESETEWWLAYTFGPPVILLIVGASLLWAARGFAGTRGPR
jgi:hypothetical protein